MILLTRGIDFDDSFYKKGDASHVVKFQFSPVLMTIHETPSLNFLVEKDVYNSGLRVKVVFLLIN